MNLDRRTSPASQLTALAVAGAVLMLNGCGPRAETKAVLTAEESNLKPLGILYGQYQTQHDNRAPANEAEFKRYIQAHGQWVLEQFNTDIDQLFVSARDGQPYVVLYRDRRPPPSGVFAYERQGVGGERIVAYPFGGVEVVDETRFRDLVPDAS